MKCDSFFVKLNNNLKNVLVHTTRFSRLLYLPLEKIFELPEDILRWLFWPVQSQTIEFLS